MDRNNKDFKALKAEWADKLAQSGFIDIETKYGRLDIGRTLNNLADRASQTSFYAKQEYYRIAGQFLHEHVFTTETEKIIWQYHAEGISIRSIVKLLKEKGHKTHRDKIHITLQKLVLEMKKYARKK